MTSLPLERAVGRMKTLYNQLKPSEDCMRELSTFSFDFEKVAKELRELRPDLFYKTQVAVEKNYAGKGPGTHIRAKDDYRIETNKLTLDTVHTLMKDHNISAEWIVDNLDTWTRCIMGVGVANPSVSTKFSVHYFLYTKTLKNLGTERHKEYLLRAAACQDLGAFGMTELGHGSNVQGVETTAHYDHDNKCFILNSPTETSIKFWIGNLGKTCAYVNIFAQLYVNGENKGVHVFLTPVRDQKTHEVFEGCTIGDCGDKLGLQGIDNGWIKFDNYRISKDMLLNKFGDVNEDGEYVSPIPSSGKRFACHMAALSGGRVLAASNGADITVINTTTAIRYGACRKQFSRKKGEPEANVMDYPLHQARLFPHFSNGLMQCVTIQAVWDEYTSMSKVLLDPSNKAGEFFHLVS
jgi:acyl-CoA oxidase